MKDLWWTPSGTGLEPAFVVLALIIVAFIGLVVWGAIYSENHPNPPAPITPACQQGGSLVACPP